VHSAQRDSARLCQEQKALLGAAQQLFVCNWVSTTLNAVLPLLSTQLTIVATWHLHTSNALTSVQQTGVVQVQAAVQLPTASERAGTSTLVDVQCQFWSGLAYSTPECTPVLLQQHA
jgi:hypothetical protein